jgi:hypothetical protein
MNRWILYLLLFTGTCSGTNNKTALTAVMTTIEQQFNVKFSYAVEDGLHQHRKPATDLTLQETIAYLNSKVL